MLLLQVLFVCFAGGLLDDQAEEDVAGVAVVPLPFRAQARSRLRPEPATSDTSSSGVKPRVSMALSLAPSSIVVPSSVGTLK